MIKEQIEGNVFQALQNREDDTVFLHGCNMQGGMGAGVARQVKERWRDVFNTYCDFLDKSDPNLGETIFARAELDPLLIVGNALTQEYYGSNGEYADKGAIQNAIETTEDFFGDMKLVSIRIGCGYGGLDWEDIEPLFEASNEEWAIYYI